MKIPKNFKLFATTVNVVFNNKEAKKEKALGFSEWVNPKLTLSDKYKGNGICDDTIMDTFYHEKVHIILDSMGYSKLSGNEKFIEVFSKLLRQSDETATF